MRARHRAPRSRRPGGVVGAVLATLLGVLVLTGSGGTWSAWHEGTTRAIPALRSGHVGLAGESLVVELLSRQPVGSRAFTSGATCVPPSGFAECRVVTQTLSSEGLVPGDTVRVVRGFTLEGAGENLAGTVTVDASRILDQSAAATELARAATVSGTVAPPGRASVPMSGMTWSSPVDRRSGAGFGAWTATVTIAIPADDAGAAWASRLWGQSLDMGSVDVSFVQS